MRNTILVLSLLLLLLIVSIPTGARASTPSLVITSSVIPSSFTQENISFIATANAPVTTWTITGTNMGVNYTSGSEQALVYGHPLPGTQKVTLTASAPGYTSATQEWTFVTYPQAFIWSIPAFTVTVNQTYTYQPNGTACPSRISPCAINWTFSGAPYLSVNTQTGVVSGVVSAGTYQNALTVHTVTSNYTQYWVTSTVGTPAVTNITCPVANHSTLTGIVSLASGLATGCGNAGVFSGENILLYTGNQTGSVGNGSYVFTDENGRYNLTGSVSHHFGLYFYGAPGMNFTPTVNGVAIDPTMPSSGFDNLSFDPSNTTSGGTTSAPGLSLPSLGGTLWLLVGATVFIVLFITLFVLYRRSHRSHRSRRR